MDDNRLLQVVWREMQDEFIRQYTHYDNLIERCYTGTNVRMEFSLQASVLAASIRLLYRENCLIHGL